eukprot:SAG31_NODE_546_length_14230_cov_18.112660_1_plen_426_part_10
MFTLVPDFYPDPVSINLSCPPVVPENFPLSRAIILTAVPRRWTPVSEWPNKSTSKDQTAVRGFLGMCSFWRRWIPGYATVAAPLNELLKKDVDVPEAWTERHSKATTELKRLLTSHPVLRQPDPGKQFEIIGDACDYAIGSALIQRYDGVPCVVAYCSRALHAAELNYSVQEKECLAIIYSLQKFRHYVLCSRIKIRISTDHHSLQYLKKPKQAHGRIARWSMILSEYDYEVTYIKGTTNHVGDALSRLIQLPEKDWKNLEVDDDTVHPFLCLFPALLHASVTLLSRSYEQSEVGERRAAAEEFALNTSGDMRHERILFANHAIQYRLISESTERKITADMYSKDPLMSIAYKMLKRGNKMHMTEYSKSLDLALNHRKDNHSTAMLKRVTKLLLNRAFIENGLLYLRHLGQELLCIPDASITKDKL